MKNLSVSTDGDATWKDLVMPKEVSKVAAISLRTPKDEYLMDGDGVLYV